MRTRGYVSSWSADEGWGVIESDETPGGSWTGFGMLAVPGFHRLSQGQQVWFEYERSEQDGYAFRTTRAWPVGVEPHDEPADVSDDAYGSTLTLRFDEDLSSGP